MTSDSGLRGGLPSGRQVIGILLTLLFVAGIVPFVVYSFPAVVGAQGSYVVLSGSMEPTIGVGDVVLVYPTDPQSLEEGDIITFHRSGSPIPVTHRVIAVHESEELSTGVMFETKGDANEDPDSLTVAGSSVIGTVPTVTLPRVGEVAVRFPYMGRVVSFVNTLPGFLLLVGLPIAAFILNEIWAVGQTRGPAESSDDTLEAASAEDDEVIQVTRTDLTATLAVLVLVSGYAVWVAYVMFEPWSVAVAVAAISGTLYVVALRATPSHTRRAESVTVADQSRTDGGAEAEQSPSHRDARDHEAPEGGAP